VWDNLANCPTRNCKLIYLYIQATAKAGPTMSSDSDLYPITTSCFASSNVARLPLRIAAMVMHNAIEWL